MHQYKKDQILNLTLQLKVLRAFALEDIVYYIVGVIRKNSVLRHTATPVFGVLRNDGTHDQIPPEALLKANELVQKEDLLKNLD